MGIKDRKEREKQGMQNLILNAASEIITKEGLDSLSVRKIASKIDYSPTIIYHYFHDKDDIVNHVMKAGYQKIISALSSVPASADTPDQKLKELTRNYIITALNMPDEYKAVQLSNSPAILEYTASLFKGASHKKPALGILVQCLKEIYKDKKFDDNSLELTAQIIVTSSWGLIIKLILENNIEEEQRDKLIDHYIKCIVDGMILGHPLYSH